MTFSIAVNGNMNDRFIRWLLRLIRFQILKNIDNRKIHYFNNIINENNIFSKNNPRIKEDFDIRKAIIISLNNLQFYRIKNVYIIRIPDNIIFPNYNVSVSTACKLFNYGNTQIQGYPLYSKVFNSIRQNIDIYYKVYLKQTLRR